jgi:Ca2+-binding EF-hand superfamily protein
LSIDELYEAYDKDHDYKLSLEEFQELYCAEIAEESTDDDTHDAETIFEQYDEDDSGKLDLSEFFAIYYVYCEDCE